MCVCIRVRVGCGVRRRAKTKKAALLAHRLPIIVIQEAGEAMPLRQALARPSPPHQRTPAVPKRIETKTRSSQSCCEALCVWQWWWCGVVKQGHRVGWLRCFAARKASLLLYALPLCLLCICVSLTSSRNAGRGVVLNVPAGSINVPALFVPSPPHALTTIMHVLPHSKLPYTPHRHTTPQAMPK